MRSLVLVALAGCGRIGFDATTTEPLAWRQLEVVDGPAARFAQGMTFDGTRTLVFMGVASDSSTRLDDMWAWNGEAWSLLAIPSMPPSRSALTVAADAARGRVTVFGGYDGTSARNDTWGWDGAAWLERDFAAAAPAPRSGHGIAYDHVRDQVVMFGGLTSTAVPETWALGQTWTRLATATAPSARFGFGMAFDAARGQTVLFGGTSDLAGVPFGDTWIWDGTDWREVTPPLSPSPSPRYGAAMVYDDARERIVLFGGSTGPQDFGDTWTWDGSTWQPVDTPDAPSPRQSAMAYDPDHGIVLFGGIGAGVALGDTWVIEH